MEDKPGGDGAADSIVLQNLPAPESTKGAVWTGIVWGGMPASDPDTEGMILIGGMPSLSAKSAIWTGLPAGFGLPEGMMPMMGDAGFGPHPLAYGTIALHESGLPNFLESGEESCFQVSLGTYFEVPPGSATSGFPADSFFDVFVEVTVGLPQAGASSELDTMIVPVPKPDFVLCTPVPEIATLIPEVAAPTSTPTPRVIPPTPTTRTGLPTATPGRVAPTQSRSD